MRNIILICLGLIGVCHAYSETKTGKGYASASSGTGSYAGSYGSGTPSFPVPPFLGGAGIGNQLAQYVADLQNLHYAGMSMTSTTGANTAHASSALHPDELFQHQFQQHQQILNQIQSQAAGSGSYGGSYGSGGYGGGFGSSGGYGGGYGGSSGSGGYGGSYGGSTGNGYGSASSSASIGPGGVHQTAHISPANPAIPNVNTRFDSSGGPGYVGVSSSSFSESSDVNGYQTNRRGSVTSVNDNGKVSTYYTHS